MKRLHEFFEDHSGGLSSARLLMILWGVGILGVWMAASIRAGVLVPIDGSVITMFGVAVGGKVAQRFGEASAPEKPKGE
jgi:hypothetical protein